MPRFITDESRIRRRMYQADIHRNSAEEDFVGPQEDFLATLDMEFTIAPATREDLKRAEEILASLGVAERDRIRVCDLVRTHLAPTTYVAGEETAALAPPGRRHGPYSRACRDMLLLRPLGPETQERAQPGRPGRSRAC